MSLCHPPPVAPAENPRSLSPSAHRVNNRPVLISYRSATRFAAAPGANASPTIRTFLPPSTAADVRGGPEPRSAQEGRYEEAAYEPRMTPCPSPQPSISIMDPSIAVKPVSGKMLFGSRLPSNNAYPKIKLAGCSHAGWPPLQPATGGPDAVRRCRDRRLSSRSAPGDPIPWRVDGAACRGRPDASVFAW